MKIGIIGVGQMGSAIAKTVSTAGYDVVLSNHNPEKADHLAQNLDRVTVASNAELVETCHVIFLGVKPYQVAQVLTNLKSSLSKNPAALWVSMSAGLELATISDYLPQESGLIRMMPNTPVAIGQGMTTYTMMQSQRMTTDQEVFEALMANSGRTLYLPETLIDAATGIAGCGPAFVFQFIEAMADAGVQNGLGRSDSLALAAQTLLGAAQLVLETGEHPAVLRDRVTSPGGSTIAGVVALEEKGFRNATIEAINRSIARTKELGKS